jgi:capsular polysaccharide biosynthesis protein
MKVKIKLPLNINQLSEGHRCLFDESFEYEEQPVLTIKNGFVTYNGIVMNGLRYEPACFYKPSNYKKKYWPFALKRKMHSSLSRWGRSHTTKIKESLPVGVIHQPYMNYFHFTIESLSRWILLKNEFPIAKILMPSELKKISYIKQFIELLNIDHIEIEESHNVKLVDLKLPTIVRWAGNHNADILLQLKNVILSEIPNENINAAPKRIFIERSGRRKIVNLEEVKTSLKPFNFDFIDFDGMTVLEQINSVRNCEILIGQHGAGLTNMLFISNNSKVIEIHINPNQNSGFFDDEYYKIASLLNYEYYSLFASKEGDNQNVYEEDIQLDVCALKTLVENL